MDGGTCMAAPGSFPLTCLRICVSSSGQHDGRLMPVYSKSLLTNLFQAACNHMAFCRTACWPFADPDSLCCQAVCLMHVRKTFGIFAFNLHYES